MTARQMTGSPALRAKNKNIASSLHRQILGLTSSKSFTISKIELHTETHSLIRRSMKLVCKGP
jgi:hypothetical protein